MPPAAQAGEPAPQALFFVSTDLPDCREGNLRFAGFRHTAVTHGLSDQISELGKGGSTRAFTEDAWLAMLRQRLSAGNNDGRLLVYIHGYNNAFEEVLDAGWLTSRGWFSGVPVVVIRWPSRASATDYIFDEGSINWSQEQIDRTMMQLAQMDSRITLVAHSMGSRAAIAAVRRIDSARPDLSHKVERVVLASPDVDRSMALRDGGLLDAMQADGRQVLVYTSRRDVPLALSRDAHGYARLGSSNCRFDVDPDARNLPKGELCHLAPERDGLAMVDTSEVASGTWFRHSDYLDSCAVRADFTAFLREENSFPLRQRVERDGKIGYVIDAELARQIAGCGD